MSAKNDAKPYGIIVKMPDNDPMSAPHLLGESWAGERWYDTEEEAETATGFTEITVKFNW